MANGIVATFHGEASSAIDGFYISTTERQLLPNVNDTYETVPGRAGAWLFENKPGMRPITLGCIVAGTSITDRHNIIDAVSTWANRTKGALVLSDQPDRTWNAKLSKAPPTAEWRLMSRFQLEFMADPYAYGATAQASVSSPSSGYTTSISIDTEVETLFVVEITPIGGTIGGTVIQVNDRVFGATDDIASGDTVTVSGISAIAYSGGNQDSNLDGSLSLSGLTTVDMLGVFGLLTNGINSVAVSYAGSPTSVNFVFKYRKLFKG